jgi:hypothetical protein
MPYFLDGNNLIGHARGAARPSEEDRQALISEVSDRLRTNQAKAVIFFDGAGQRRTVLGNLTVRDAGARGADEAIVGEIERSRTAREVIVVTADRELARRAKDAGARVIAPGEFWKQFGRRKPQEGAREERRVDVDDWMRYFGDEKNRRT